MNISSATRIARRQFLLNSACSVGSLALTSLLQRDGLAAGDIRASNPLAHRPPHFAPRAQNCIFIFLAGGPSQIAGQSGLPPDEVAELAAWILVGQALLNLDEFITRG